MTVHEYGVCQVDSAFIWFDVSKSNYSAEELCLKLQDLTVGQRKIKMDFKPLNEIEFQNCLLRTEEVGDDEGQESEETSIDFDKNSLKNMVKTTLGSKWATKMIQEIDENVVTYQEYQMLHKKSKEFVNNVMIMICHLWFIKLSKF